MSENPNVDERTPESPVDLRGLGDSLLGEAAESDNGRAAVTLTPSAGGPLKQTLLALRAGHALAEHTAPGPASLHVIVGEGALLHDGEETSLRAGAWVPIPRSVHSVRADEDLVALLTVVPNPDVPQDGQG